MEPIEERELRDWLALYRAPGIGVRTFARLVERFGSPGQVLSAVVREIEAFGLPAAVAEYFRQPDWDGVDADLAWARNPRRRILIAGAPDYPHRLRAIADPPPVLFVEGDAEVLGRRQIAIVGSRSPTAGGAETAHEFGRALAIAGFTITSGLALGIDAAGHRGALAADGTTIAVMGTGPDRVYPRQHAGLADAIAGRGALITEFPVGTPVTRDNFPRRNRIISGLCEGVLVVEAARASGSLITARHAMEQGREVFAIPGSIHNPLARGCHALIRDGAKLVESVDDILAELPPAAAATGPAIRPAAVTGPGAAQARSWTGEQQRLLEAMEYEPLTVDALVGRSGLTANAVSSILLILELEGIVHSQPGGFFVKQRPRD